MVAIVIQRNRHGAPMGFSCSGHAGFAAEGTDIVCAAISSLTHTAVLALDQLADLPLRVETDLEEGFLSCEWDDDPAKAKEIEIIIAMMAIGLRQIAVEYPEYLQLSEVEV